MRCPSCTTVLPAQAAFCFACGAATGHCAGCQARLVPGASFCVSCGASSDRAVVRALDGAAARIEGALERAAAEAGDEVVGFLYPPGRPLDRHPITLGDNTLGAGDKNHVVVKLPAVSWNHALIIARPDRVLVQDSASTNGTFVDDQQIQRPTTLHHDASLRLGNVELTLWLRPEHRG